MKKKQRLQSIIFTFQWVYWLQILGLLILLIAPFLILFLFPRAVHAEAMFSIHGGLGDFQIKTKKTKDDQFQSVSKNSRRHVGLGLDLEKEGYPLRVSLQWTLFTTEEESEKWTIGPLHVNRLDIQGGTFDVHAFVTPYTYSSGKDTIRLKPFIGGGLGYKHFKLERKGLNEIMLTDPNAVQYFLGNQAIMAIGATPHIGFFLEIPKLEVECSLSLGWTFHAAKSNIDYHVFSKSDEVIHPVTIHTSGSSLIIGTQVVKSWESFSLALGYIWEKTQINDKPTPFDFDGDGMTDPFPEFEIIQTFGQISLKYLF
jgi:hypothetical protein